MGSMKFQQLEALSLGPGGVKLFATEKFVVAPIQKLPIQWDRNLTHFEGQSKAMKAMSFWECAKCRIFWTIPTPPKISRACSIIDSIALQRNTA